MLFVILCIIALWILANAIFSQAFPDSYPADKERLRNLNEFRMDGMFF